MGWKQIKTIEKEKFAYIGNHSHSHDYLVNFDKKDFIKDINKANKTFQKNLGYNPIFFSYPFGEYSEFIKKYISKNLFPEIYQGPRTKVKDQGSRSKDQGSRALSSHE